MVKKSQGPQSGPIGNKNNSERGRDIPPGGRKGSSSAKSDGGSQTDRKATDPDVEGYSIGGGTR